MDLILFALQRCLNNALRILNAVEDIAVAAGGWRTAIKFAEIAAVARCTAGVKYGIAEAAAFRRRFVVGTVFMKHSADVEKKSVNWLTVSVCLILNVKRKSQKVEENMREIYCDRIMCVWIVYDCQQSRE